MERETRVATIGDLELREAEDGFTFSGYAAVFDSPTDIGPFREQVARGAFSKTLNDQADVRFLVNHDGVPLARSKSGTLALEEDGHGLRVRAKLDPNNPTVQELASAMRRGDLDQMSFAFQAVRDEWDDADAPPLRTLKEAKLFDVSAVTYPAYADTTAEMRSQAEAIYEQHTEAAPPTAPLEDTRSEERAELEHPVAPDLRHRYDQRRRRRRLALT